MTTQRRRITARDVKPLGTCQHAYANSWCYATVAPARGDAFFLVLPKLTTAHMQVFVDAFAATYSYTFNAIFTREQRGAYDPAPPAPGQRCPRLSAAL